jgi:hypothetical protein
MADDRVKPVAESALSPRESPGRRLFPLLFGLLLAISLLKFGNPPIMEQWVSPPTDIYEFIFAGPWPITWAYALTATVLLCGLINYKLTKPSLVAVIPGIWLIWQLLASWTSVDVGLSALTTKHFIVCICCFYLGYYALSRSNELTLFWGCLVAGFIVVLASGWQQHFGGLEATRKYFFEQIYPTLKVVPPDYLKKMNSTRIFSTLFYPNSLAGAMILLLPSILLVLWQLRSSNPSAARITWNQRPRRLFRQTGAEGDRVG